MNSSFEKLKNYIESSSAFTEVTQCLKKGVQIGFVLESGEECSLNRIDDKPVLTKEKAKKADFIFSIKDQGLETLLQTPDDISQIGVALLKQMNQENVSFRVPGSLFSILRNGYLEIIRLGGKGFWSYLSERGITSPTKIIGVLKGLKK